MWIQWPSKDELWPYFPVVTFSKKNNILTILLILSSFTTRSPFAIKVCYNSFTLYARLSNGYCPSDNSIHHMVWFFGVVLVGIGCFQFRWFGWFQMDLGFFIGYICFEVIVIWYHCVKRAPLLYFIRSWVALSFKVVSQSGIGNTCPDLHFVQYIKA